jgi:HEPN domain-containing protein
VNIHDYISELIDQAENDYGAANALFNAGYYGHSMFWAHLTLEKTCKALWIYSNNSLSYPFVHNLLKLLKECPVNLSVSQIEFFGEMNQFQTQGRYGDSLKKLELSVDEKVCKEMLVKTKSEMQWLLNQMQKK